MSESGSPLPGLAGRGACAITGRRESHGVNEHGPARARALHPPISPPISAAVPSFLAGGGETGALIAARDWSRTPLGPIEGWPQSLRTAASILLRSPVPIVLLWGEDGVMLYNDAYSVFAGGRHPGLLGSKGREGWP